MEDVCFSKRVLSTSKSKRRYNPEDQHWQVLYLTDLGLNIYELRSKTVGLITTLYADRPVCGHCIASDRILTNLWCSQAPDLVLVLVNNLACGLRHNSRKLKATLLVIENAFDYGLNCTTCLLSRTET
jgi:hypothetical protein